MMRCTMPKVILDISLVKIFWPSVQILAREINGTDRKPLKEMGLYDLRRSFIPNIVVLKSQ